MVEVVVVTVALVPTGEIELSELDGSIPPVVNITFPEVGIVACVTRIALTVVSTVKEGIVMVAFPEALRVIC